MIRKCIVVTIIGVMGVCLVVAGSGLASHSAMTAVSATQCMNLRAGQCESRKCVDSGSCAGNSINCGDYGSEHEGGSKSACTSKTERKNQSGYKDWSCQNRDGYTGCDTYQNKTCRKDYNCRWGYQGACYSDYPSGSPDNTVSGQSECDDADGGHTT